MIRKIAICTLFLTMPVSAAVCDKMRYKDGDIVEVKSALLMGGRIQLPSTLIAKPVVSNSHLWDVEGAEGTTHILLKPNSKEAEGKSTMIYAFTSDGGAYDIMATRVEAKHNQPCVRIENKNAFLNPQQQLALKRAANPQNTMPIGQDSARNSRLEKELASIKTRSEDEKKRAVVNALRKYQYRIYTRYEWDEGKEFVGNNTVADVYDDGQFTFIRLANPNRGILSVETVIGGKTAIAPTKYDDAYGMYRVTGIYPTFTMRVDDVKIEVKRRDNATKGNT
ncbi:TrbG/VirB9 family P-type conjugative transfer protein [Vibrio coralliilyticus]|uniref:TrbG/VirB9 family P-type conjugative transfer protein n=1 Tax=Vibrio coralliilyticus TaxID=190893 RepID=UPI00211F4160|nr:TrbG/VirB9 family P-type conjugative transfer protein [Vibrio coralliilyticus]